MSEKFRTVFDRIRVNSNPGSPFLNDYKISYDDDGARILVKSGEINVYNQIQACRDSVDINMILERYINVGDPSILNVKPTFYGDVSEIPTNFADILKLGAEAENTFNSLTPEQKAIFDNNKDVFFASIGTEKFKKAFEINESEVISSEQKSE